MKPNPEAPYGHKKDGKPRKRPAGRGGWKKGEPGNPATIWKPGVSPNPGGRPKKTPITDELRALLSELHPNQKKYPGKTWARVLAERMIEAAEAGDLSTQKEITDRVEGKPAQAVTLGGEGGGAIPFVNVSPAENEKRIAELLAMAGGSDARPAYVPGRPGIVPRLSR
jgi:hypothetical protein